jgi:hydrogenase maturation protease
MLPETISQPLSPDSTQPSIIVVGLGNPILGDDGVGWKVAEEVKNRLEEKSTGLPQPLPVAVECCSLGGLSLMEQLIGFDRAIIVDAFAVNRPAGTIFAVGLKELPNHSSLHAASAHDTSLQNALAMGRTMGAHLPKEVTLVGVATEQQFEFSEELTPNVAAAVPQAVQIVLNLIFRGDTK